MNSDQNKERRKGAQRRHIDAGPPSDCGDRRVNIERRLFNLDVGCVEEWLSKPASSVAARNRSSS